MRLLHPIHARYHAAQRWLAPRPAALLGLLGFGLGGTVAVLALLGLGSWGGLGVCVGLLGALLPLVRGAEPVLRPVPPRAQRGQPPPPLKVPVTPPEPVRPVVVIDIPGLLEMVELPGGTFRMGSPEEDEQAYSDEQPQHTVTVSGFAMSRCTVTRQLYRAVMGAGSRRWQEDTDDAQLPASYATWFDAVEFCNRLSARQGYTPCYRLAGDEVVWDHEADGYRLPTEAEWEYAARAGTTTRWVCGEEPSDLAAYAWFGEGVVAGRPHPVGTKRANLWGLCDMAGNVWEWCWDWYERYNAIATTDPVSPSTGVRHVLRGGAYWRAARDVRSALRRRDGPELQFDAIGVRVVRRPRRQP